MEGSHQSGRKSWKATVRSFPPWAEWPGCILYSKLPRRAGIWLPSSVRCRRCSVRGADAPVLWVGALPPLCSHWSLNRPS